MYSEYDFQQAVMAIAAAIGLPDRTEIYAESCPVTGGMVLVLVRPHYAERRIFVPFTTISRVDINSLMSDVAELIEGPNEFFWGK
jgi:hypothetical protein